MNGNVGRSWRSPGKIRAFRAVALRTRNNFNELASLGLIDYQVYLDLNSGDGGMTNTKGTKTWHQSCTPGIAIFNAGEALKAGSGAIVQLHEINKSTRRKLHAAIANELPVMAKRLNLDWVQEAPDLWTCRDGMGLLTVEIDGDRYHRLPDRAAVFVMHDPNHFYDWTMGEDVLDSLDEARFLVTAHWLGFNPDGTKRLANDPRPLVAERWADNVELLHRVLQPRKNHEILLVRVLNDTAHWAFVAIVHKTLIEDVERDVVRGMTDEGLNVAPYIESETPLQFEHQLDELLNPRNNRKRTIPRQ